jgi:hypothetical protein
MRKLLLGFVALTASHTAFATTCTSISRSNVAASSVLTSTEYNNSLNTAYSAINSFSGGCIQSATVGTAQLSTTEFAALFNGLREGCAVTNTDTNTLSVDRCILSVNGSFVKTAIATTVTWGCSGCSAEVTSTIYYLYAKTGSSGTTLNLLISTTAPNGDGYDASGNRVLAKFYNDSSSNIYGVQQWSNGQFVNSRSSVHLTGGNGYGATNTKIRRFSTTALNIGDAITCTDSANNGLSCTINSDGIYSFQYIDVFSAGACQIGISLNSAQLTTSIQSVTASTRIAWMTSAGSNLAGNAVGTYFFKSGDVVRPHTDAQCDATTTASFIITKVSP